MNSNKIKLFEALPCQRRKLPKNGLQLSKNYRPDSPPAYISTLTSVTNATAMVQTPLY